MSNSVHGHDVMRFMLENGGAFTRESLIRAVTEHFGSNTRFHTCSADGMTAEELVDLLAEKGKFIENENGFNTRADKICNH